MKGSHVKILKLFVTCSILSLPPMVFVFTRLVVFLDEGILQQRETFLLETRRLSSKQLQELKAPLPTMSNNTAVEFQPKGDVGVKLQTINSTKSLAPSLRDKVILIDNSSSVTFPVFVDSDDPHGPGENGTSINVNVLQLNESDRRAYKEGWRLNNFNEYVSSKISVHRKLSLCSPDKCKQAVKSFNGSLDPLSVIIIFHNEAWSTLLRSVHSVLSRTQEHLLREIILVDDCSTLGFLGAPLEKYFSKFPKVKIVRSDKKIGLIKARLLGFEASTAPVVVFFDAHIECFPDWAEPLLMQISLNQKAVVFPLIDGISDKTFAVDCNTNPIYYGTFHFTNLMFDWVEIPRREFDRRKDITEPFRSPTMPGGLFAISRKFFIELGTYDPEMDFWGGENIELSFKTWMCGGTLLMDACSHVAHVFRSSVPTKGAPNAVMKNSMRVAEVWMDDYKNYFYEATNYQTVDYGNVTDRKMLRDRLKCHNFEWYLRNVFPELTIPHGIDYVGKIKSEAAPKCLDSGPKSGSKAIMYECHRQGNNQLWYFTNNHQIHRDNMFLCVKNGLTVLEFNECSSQGSWKYQDDKRLVYLPTNQCLTAGVTDGNVSLAPCHPNNKWQLWDVQRRRSDLIFPR